MLKTDKKFVGVVLLGIIIIGLFFINQKLPGNNNDVPKQVTVTTDNSESYDSISIPDIQPIESVGESEKGSDTNQVQVRSESFQQEVSQAYQFEKSVLIGRAFVLAYYNFNGEVPSASLFESLSNSAIAEAMVNQLQELKDKGVKREETLTTFTIQSSEPLTIRYHIIGKNNDEKEEVSYDVIFDAEHQKITSFVQVVR